jgi:hypothetical protein
MPSYCGLANFSILFWKTLILFVEKARGAGTRVQSADNPAGDTTNREFLSFFGNLLPFCYYSIQ